MTVSTAQKLAKRFMVRTGFLVSWIDIRKAYMSDNIIKINGVNWIAVPKIKL